MKSIVNLVVARNLFACEGETCETSYRMSTVHDVRCASVMRVLREMHIPVLPSYIAGDRNCAFRTTKSFIDEGFLPSSRNIVENEGLDGTFRSNTSEIDGNTIDAGSEKNLCGLFVLPRCTEELLLMCHWP